MIFTMLSISLQAVHKIARVWYLAGSGIDQTHIQTQAVKKSYIHPLNIFTRVIGKSFREIPSVRSMTSSLYNRARIIPLELQNILELYTFTSALKTIRLQHSKPYTTNIS
jgi:hypothetical protein